MNVTQTVRWWHKYITCLTFLPRNFIWRSLLHLPENHAAYSSLVDKGTYSAFAQIHEEYPIKSRKLLRVLQRYQLRRLRILNKVFFHYKWYYDKQIHTFSSFHFHLYTCRKNWLFVLSRSRTHVSQCTIQEA